MDLHQYISTLDFVGRCLGENGWPIVQPILERKMRKDKIIGISHLMHSGVYYELRFTN